MKNSIRRYFSVTTAFVLLISISCKKEDTISLTTPIVTTTTLTEISRNTTTSGGFISSDGGSAVTDRGVCWSINTNPTIADNKTSDGKGNEGFTSTISGLKPNTAYHIRAYATNSVGVSYGNDIPFITLAAPVINNEIVTDIDGNIYHTVTIGTQVWMVENLRVTHYRNGESIPNITENDKWDWNTSYIKSAYCDYNNEPANSVELGRLYKWYTVSDPRILAPKGWHVPTNAEWKILTDYLIYNGYGFEGNVSGIAKSMAATSGWIIFDTPGTVGNDQASNNITNFSAQPAGFRNYNGSFLGSLGSVCTWWSSSPYETVGAYCISLYNDYSIVIENKAALNYGFSVRCVKD